MKFSGWCCTMIISLLEIAFWTWNYSWIKHINGLVQDCSNSIANALELLQSCSKPSICQLLDGMYVSAVVGPSYHWWCLELIASCWMVGHLVQGGGRFKNAYELLNPRALKISVLYKNRIFQCMGKIFCAEFQRSPLKFHTKYLTHALKDVSFILRWKFKSSWI